MPHIQLGFFNDGNAAGCFPKCLFSDIDIGCTGSFCTLGIFGCKKPSFIFFQNEQKS